MDFCYAPKRCKKTLKDLSSLLVPEPAQAPAESPALSIVKWGGAFWRVGPEITCGTAHGPGWPGHRIEKLSDPNVFHYKEVELIQGLERFSEEDALRQIQETKKWQQRLAKPSLNGPGGGRVVSDSEASSEDGLFDKTLWGS